MKEQGTTTKTASDLNLDLKVIKLEINKFKAEKEAVQKELLEFQSARDSLQNEFKGVVDLSELRNAVFENTIRGRLKKNIDELEDKIAKFTLEQEKYNTSISELKKKEVELSLEVSQKSSQLETTKNALETYLTEYQSSQKTLGPQIERLKTSLSILKQENREEQAKNDLFKEDFLNKKIFILKEEERLANKSQDLHIYEARLRKHCLELWPELQIVI